MVCRLKDGGSCRIRTYDQLIKSQLLYQLSLRPATNYKLSKSADNTKKRLNGKCSYSFFTHLAYHPTKFCVIGFVNALAIGPQGSNQLVLWLKVADNWAKTGFVGY